MANMAKRAKKPKKPLLELEKAVADNLFRCQSGVVLRLKPVGHWFVWESTRDLVEPKPPVVLIEGKRREEENLADPAYQAALTQYQMERSDRVVNAFVGLGTAVESIPKGVPKPDDEGWQEDMEAVGIPAKRGRLARYVQWVKLVALSGDAFEVTRLNNAIGRTARATEADVRQIEESFRGIP